LRFRGDRFDRRDPKAARLAAPAGRPATPRCVYPLVGRGSYAVATLASSQIDTVVAVATPNTYWVLLDTVALTAEPNTTS